MSITIDEYLMMLRRSFLPERARDAHAVFQYEFSGSQDGVCHIVVEAGTLHAARGPHPHPLATVSADFDLWLRTVSYHEDPLLLYQAGAYRITGDVEALMIADTWFKR